VISKDNPSVAAPLRHPLLHREGKAIKYSRKQNRILRPRPTFAHTCAYGERVNAARYYVAIAPQRENTLSGIYAMQWVVS